MGSAAWCIQTYVLFKWISSAASFSASCMFNRFPIRSNLQRSSGKKMWHLECIKLDRLAVAFTVTFTVAVAVAVAVAAQYSAASY